MKKALTLLILLITPALMMAAPKTLAANLPSSTAQACAQDATVCSYYCRVGETLGCDASNYLFELGHKYCLIYLEHEQEFSPPTQAILQKIRPCLIASLENQSGITCQNVEALGEKSHEQCYIDNGFCQLPWDQKEKIARYALKEIFNPRQIGTMSKIIKACEKSGKR